MHQGMGESGASSVVKRRVHGLNLITLGVFTKPVKGKSRVKVCVINDEVNTF